jgi:hypothetical protein
MVLTRSMSQKLQTLSCGTNVIIGYKLVFVDPESIVVKRNKPSKTLSAFGIAKLEILTHIDSNLVRPVDNIKYAKYRAATVRVLKIRSIRGKELYGRGYSVLKPGGYYTVGKEIHADSWNAAEINTVCTNGIHFYLSKNAVFSLYKKITFMDSLPFFKGERIDKKSSPNSIYVSSDDDGKIDYKLYYDEKGTLNKIKYPSEGKTYFFNDTYEQLVNA